MVRDESPVVCRALNSVRNLINVLFLCDTGSTDGTPEIVKDWCTKERIEGQFLHHPWRNFGYNRSWLWKQAYEHPNPQISQATYYIFMDADEVWITEPSNLQSDITRPQAADLIKYLDSQSEIDMFDTLTYEGRLQYNITKICRNNQLYQWILPVHEYIEGTRSNRRQSINTLFLYARKEGHSSRNPSRYQQDLQMLLEYITHNPDEPRPVFYLAQTYETLNQSSEALNWYRKRVDLSGYYQEKYIAALKVGRLSSDEEEKIQYLLRGTTIVPQRLECYYELMMMEYHRKNFAKSAGYGLMAGVPGPNRKPQKDDMFAELEIYDYLFDLNLGVSCYYSGFFQLGYDATVSARTNATDAYHRDLLSKNLLFFDGKVNTKVS